MKTIFNLILKFVSVDTICRLIAMAIAKLLEVARVNGGDAWDKSKVCIQHIEDWCKLFNEVYADDNLTVEEEAKIEELIKNSTLKSKLEDILNK